MEIELIISDSCKAPELIRGEGVLQIVIGLSHGYDDILDVCGAHLSGEQLGLLYRLWGDDEFPRNFIRDGERLRITERRSSTGPSTDGA